MAEVPYRFERTAEAGSLQERYAALGPGEETEDEVAVAGRVMLNRPQGRLGFATLRDSSGTIQLFAAEKVRRDCDVYSKLSQGDWVGAAGRVVKTRKGERSVQVHQWTLLAEAR